MARLAWAADAVPGAFGNLAPAAYQSCRSFVLPLLASGTLERARKPTLSKKRVVRIAQSGHPVFALALRICGRRSLRGS